MTTTVVAGAIYQAAGRLPEDVRARLLLELDHDRRMIVRMCELLPDAEQTTPGFEAARAKRCEALDLIVPIVSYGELPDYDYVMGMFGDRHDWYFGTVLQTAYSGLTRDDRTALRRALRAVEASAVSDGVEASAEYLGWLCDREEEHEAELAAL